MRLVNAKGVECELRVIFEGLPFLSAVRDVKSFGHNSVECKEYCEQ